MQETNIKHLRINRLTEEQYETAVKSDTELYLTPDTTDQDIADAIATHNSSSSAHSTLLSGYVVTSRKINNKALTADITLTASDVGAISSHQDIKTLKTDNTTAQTTSSSEAIAGSGTINLHKVSKTGSYSDLLNKPTIPATNVIPTTTTANKVLVSTTTSGTAKWSDFSSAGLLKTNTSGVISVDTTTYYSKPSGGIPSTDLAESYYLASNPSGYTSNTGTVTSVRVQATSPVQSSTSTAQSTSLNTTISLANAYGDTKNPYGTKTANYVLAGPTSGSAAAPTFRALEKSDIPLASETAASGGSTTSLVTTGEKYTWNNKQDAISDLSYIRTQVDKVDDKIGSQDITNSGSSLPSASTYSVGDTFLNTTDNKLYTVTAPAWQLNSNVTVDTGVSIDLTTGIASGFHESSSVSTSYYGINRTSAGPGWSGQVQYNIHFKLTSLPSGSNYYTVMSLQGGSYRLDFILSSNGFYVRYAYSYMGPTSYGDYVELFNFSNWQTNKEYFITINKNSDGIVNTSLKETSYNGNILSQGETTYSYTCGTNLYYGIRGNYYGTGDSFSIGQIYLLDSTGEFLIADGALQWDSGVTLEDNIQYNDTTNKKTLYYNNNILYEKVDNTSVQGRIIGQIIQSTIPLVDAGLHLADGSLIDGNGVYKDFYEYMLNGNENAIKFRGSLTNNNGVISGFTNNNCLQLNGPTARVDNSEYVVKFTTSDDLTTSQAIIASEHWVCLDIGNVDGKLSTYNWETDSAVVLNSVSANTTYWVKIVCNGTSRTFSISTDGTSYTQMTTYTDNTLNNTTMSETYDFVLGRYSHDSSNPFLGSIDLNGSYIKRNNEFIWDGSNYTVLPRYMNTQRNYDWFISSEGYGVCGQYVLDPTNKTIRLPKLTGIIEGTLDPNLLGDVTEAGLPNITATFQQLDTALSDASGSLSGALYGTSFNSWSRSGSDRQCIDGGFDASRSNSIYGNSDTVQPQTINCFYYIVISILTKTDIEVNIDEIVTDLNNKVDKNDLIESHVIIKSYANGSSWYNLYSNGWIEQGGKYTYSSAGQKTISLLESIDTTRPVYFSYKLVSTRAGGAYERECNINSYTSSNFVVYTSTSNGSEAFWEAKGYIL